MDVNKMKVNTILLRLTGNQPTSAPNRGQTDIMDEAIKAKALKKGGNRMNMFISWERAVSMPLSL